MSASPNAVSPNLSCFRHLHNRRRGEVVATIGGQPVRLRLTLGALAELETAFQVDDLAQLAARFGRGALSARDLQAIVTVAMRGAGRCVTDAQAADLPVAGELPGLARAVAELLALTFGDRVAPRASTSRDDASGEGLDRPFVRRMRTWGRRLFPGMR